MNEVIHPTELIALNAEGGGVPDWINVIPAGPGIRGIDGRAWTLSDANAVIETFRRRGNKLPVDIEHSTQLKGGVGDPAPAMGFITDLESRETGLWAKVDWNAAGTELLRSGAYAHCSPVFAYDAARQIRRLVSVGLTNNPNLDLVALNRAFPSQPEETPAMDKAVLEALGLNSDASAADAVVAITKLKEAEQVALNRAAVPDPEKFVPRADHLLALNRVAAFEAAEKTRADEAITAAVDAAIKAGKVAPASRDYHLAACRTEGGLETFTAMVAGLPEIVTPATPRAKDAGSGGVALNTDQRAIAAAYGWTEDQAREAFAAEKKG
ncbi:phage protease [Palleronia caenipelagi]|uniref:Peptidase n=1 Tax=Palleronia caenipelagi TaxID=2489174 RepID=A0A547PW61_9RHOB|nr:phage protease [Palleronia caenipelagi]TRD18387.1 peptidase [Palleronia caenipelagi]